MEQTTFPIYKSRPMRPFLYSHLVTSNPDSHQTSKRIKGLLGYSEHYKENRIDYRNTDPSFPPLRTRDYRKARELTLEIWDPIIQISFLERFLKSQRNLQDIRIKVFTRKAEKEEIWKRLCKVLGKIGRINRVHIDFEVPHLGQRKLDFVKGMRSLKNLPRLKDLDVTVGGRPVLPFSLSLAKMNSDSKKPLERKVLEKLMKRIVKFHQLDTIKFDFTYLCSWSWHSIFIISKLPNFRELDLKYTEDICLSLEEALQILDALMDAPKFEILRLELPRPGESQLCLLKHPIFKAKSLKRTFLSFEVSRNFTTQENFNQVFTLLGEIPSLYGLSVEFPETSMIPGEIAARKIKEISQMTSIRKLKIELPYSPTTLKEKPAGNIFRSIFKMHFLEELELRLPQDCLGLTARDIQGLPRLKKASLNFSNPQPKQANDLLTIMKIVGECHQLRELELRLSTPLSDFQELALKSSESLRKLKKLQVFKFITSGATENSEMMKGVGETFENICHQLRNVQDLKIVIGGWNFYGVRHGTFGTKKKYRFVF